MSPQFLVTCAIDALRNPELGAWANLPAQRARFEGFAALVLDDGAGEGVERTEVPATELRASVARAILEAFEAR